MRNDDAICHVPTRPSPPFLASPVSAAISSHLRPLSRVVAGNISHCQRCRREPGETTLALFTTHSRLLMISPRLIARAARPLTRYSPITYRAMATASAPTEPVVLFESNGSSRTYKLNRPRPLHSLNEEMIELLAEKVKAWGSSDLCKVIIGTSTTDKGFCAGGDVKSVVQMVKDDKLDEALRFFQKENSLDYALAKLGKPYVVFMNGITMGGGAGISYPATLRVATPSTEFAMPETKIGFAPDVGSQFYLAQLDGFVGAWMGVTGQSIYGRTVYELGIATHYIPQRSLHDVIAAIQAMEEPTQAKLAALINTYSAPPATEGKDGHSPIRGAVRELLDEAFGKPTVKEIMATLARATKGDNAEVAKWAGEQLEIMRCRSPTGMKVALHNFRQARETRHLQTQLNNDLAMCTAFLTPSNTMEMVNGVSHVLITKGAKKPMTWDAPKELYPNEPPAYEGAQGPAWEPASLDDPRLAEDRVARTWFDRERSPVLKNAPVLAGFNAADALLSSMRADKLWGQFRAWGLPSEAMIKQFVEGSAKSSDAFALTQKELTDRLVRSLCERFETQELSAGFKQGIEDVVQEVVSRKCEVQQEKGQGYLRWKSRSISKL